MSAVFRAPVENPSQVLSLSGPAYWDAVIRPHKVKLHLSMAGSIVTTKRVPQDADRLLLTFEGLTIT
jgi:hypothetical protein